MKMAASVIGLYARQDDGNFGFPNVSAPSSIVLEKDEFLVLGGFDLIEYLKNTSDKAVKKTLTIPSWLNISMLLNLSKNVV